MNKRLMEQEVLKFVQKYIIPAAHYSQTCDMPIFPLRKLSISLRYMSYWSFMTTFCFRY